MPNHSISLGKILGINLRIDQSWFIMFAFLSWILAENYFPIEMPDLTTMVYWVLAIVTSFLFFGTFLLHELGHSLTAQHFKLKPTYIILYVFGGLADIGGDIRKALNEFWIALAGPMTSLLVAVILYFFGGLMINYPAIRFVLHYLSYTNFLLAFFNMLPAFPLDGGRVFRALLWKFTNEYQKATHISIYVSRGIAFLFIFIGLMTLVAGHVSQGLWIIFIGWFLESATAAQSRVIESSN
jgi:Zn-dependent protease